MDYERSQYYTGIWLKNIVGIIKQKKDEGT